MNTIRTAVALTLLTSFGPGAAQSQTTVPHVFQAGAPARASDVNANFDVLETAANDNANAIADLESQVTDLVESSDSRPRWRVLRDDGTGQYIEVSDIVLDERIANPAEQNLSVVMVKLTDDHPQGLDWYPAVIGENRILAFGYQGTAYNHTILAYQPNSNCSGPPVKLVVRSTSFPTTGSPGVPFRGYTAYDYRSGDIYYHSGSGGGDSNVNYDLLEYGNEKGFFPLSDVLGCSVNVNLSTRPDLSNGSDSILLEPVLIGNSPPRAGEGLFIAFR